MMRSLYSGVTGLRNHQTRMDVIANNIANVNTIGYKTSRTIFEDIYSETIQPAAGEIPGSRGGVNPQQIGLGMKLSTIDVMHGRAAPAYTGNTLDVSIEGEGFFIVQDPTNPDANFYTRAGNFKTDALGNLVTAGGLFVMSNELEPIAIEPIDDYVSVEINSKGEVWAKLREGDGDDNNGNVLIATLGIATFVNAGGLQKLGGNFYGATANSGEPVVSAAGEEGAGKVIPGTLEMSNVDLAFEFTEMIVTQRGFQANARIITTSDQILEELVNIKR